MSGTIRFVHSEIVQVPCLSLGMSDVSEAIMEEIFENIYFKLLSFKS